MAIMLETQKNLTTRERQIVDLVSEGLSNKEIARQIGLTEGTIKQYLHSIFTKLGINKRVSLFLTIKAPVSLSRPG